MRPAHSYQSPSMTPPDEPEYEYHDDMYCEVPVGGTEVCGDRAVMQDDINTALCDEHYEVAMQEKAEDEQAERQIERINDNGGYEYPIGYDGR